MKLGEPLRVDITLLLLHWAEAQKLHHFIGCSVAMALREDNPIWLDAKETICTLFHDQADSDWLKLEQRKLIPTPSRASIEDFNVKECCEIRAELQKGFNHIFEHTHVNTF